MLHVIALIYTELNMSNFAAGPNQPLLVLIAGPFMSGTGGDPEKIAVNRTRLESYAFAGTYQYPVAHRNFSPRDAAS